MARRVASVLAAFAAITSSFAAPVLEARQSTGGVYCHPFAGATWVEKGNAHLEMVSDDNYGGGSSFLPSDVTIAPNKFAVLANHTGGTVFGVESCIVNMTNVNLTPSVYTEYCGDGECAYSYYNFLRIRNFATGECMTPNYYQRNTSLDITAYTFAPCDPQPADSRQFYATHQYVSYSGASTNFIGAVYLQPGTDDNRGWRLPSNDKRTLESENSVNTGLYILANQP